MVPMVIAVMARPGAGDDCPEDQRNERGECPSRPEAGRPPAGKGVRAAPPAKRPSCPAGMALIPAGMFGMGNAKNAAYMPDELPRHEVTLPGFCIDKTEVTVKAYAACVAAKGCSAAPRTVNSSKLSPENVERHSQFCNREDRPDHPINCVDWTQATAYCKWARKRLPTEAEWEYAARGIDGRIYSWGNDPPSAQRLNACGPECASTAGRALGWIDRTLYDAADGWETTAPAGSVPGDASPFGVLDMGGNVREWTADRYGEYSAAPVANPLGAQTGWARVIRGGGWSSRDRTFDGRAVSRESNEPSVRGMSIGFRCARDG